MTVMELDQKNQGSHIPEEEGKGSKRKVKRVRSKSLVMREEEGCTKIVDKLQKSRINEMTIKLE